MAIAVATPARFPVPTRDAIEMATGFHKKATHLPHHPELNAPRYDSEEYGGTQERDHKHIVSKDTADGCNDFFHNYLNIDSRRWPSSTQYTGLPFGV